MPLPILRHRLARLLLLVALGRTCSAAAATEAAASTAPTSGASKVVWNLAEFVDGLPDLLAERLPGYDPNGAVRIYVRPHFGDFIHEDYVRVPFGARMKVTENVESFAELQTYFTHGLGDAAGYGLSTLRLGTKCEHVFPTLNSGAGVSIGLNYETPLSRPPIGLTDGHRHTRPFVAGTRPLMPEWKLLGYASVEADLLDRTPIPAHFGRNQLHSNSLTFTAGAAREWPRFRGSLTATWNTASVLSDEGKNVYALRPEVVVPCKTKYAPNTLFFLTLSGRTVWGPDGHELGVSSSVRIEFLLHRSSQGN